ncbi:3-deoxy-7-phosphoheptulonate synthase [Actinosynnema sp.]|uniref:3-deoxy-7-phosphoheptulonate synthase n=1 Tax=Actinosynnema sp. TaxID=1872144 RepID=UPI003F8551A2
MVSERTAGAPLAADPVAAPARQQPQWPDPAAARRVREELARRPPLVAEAEVAALRAALAEVALGRARVVQAGDCAEDPDRCGPRDVRAKADQLDRLAAVVRERTGRPVLRIGRIAGQFAKPRSHPTERIGDLELPAYRGPMVHGPRPDTADRVADPRRMALCHDRSARVLAQLRARGRTGGDEVWTSHEALVLDYELPQVRPADAGGLLLTSAHLPWVGERTRQPGGAHVRLLASVRNPVACKVGPTTSEAELLELCSVLDPCREPGRLTLIARMGADRVLGALPPLVRAVRAQGHPVVWLCDPVHGNTSRTPDGRKTRVVTAVVRELEHFQDTVLAHGGAAGGLHLETTPDEVAECVWSADQLPGQPYTTLCDPRLNPAQAVDVALAWIA